MASSVLSSQSVIITTAAMAVSGAVIILSLCRIKNLPSFQQLPISHNSVNSPSLRSCLSSESLKREKKNKKKRVRFADNVKDGKNETSYAKKKNNDELVRAKKVSKLREMPANRAALYHGIIRDRPLRVQSY